MSRCVVVFAGALLACAHGRRSLSYPPAPRADVVDDQAGVRVADPYRGLEDIDAPATERELARVACRYVGTELPGDR